jgi:hypothetical protein
MSFDSGTSDGVCHIFHATVAWAGTDRNALPTIHTCQIPAAQLEALFKKSSPSGSGSEAGRHPWLALVSNLIYRESDRACLHVGCQLQASNKAAYRGEGARWAHDWETSTPKSGAFLSASRLQCQLGNGGWIPLHDLDRVNLAAYSREQIPFLLPCGQSASFAVKVLSMTEDPKSAEVACLECGEKVLGDKELTELALRLECHERADFCYSDAEYSDAKIQLSAAGRGQQLKIPPGALHHALQHALESLRVPESASPAALSLADVAEAKAVLRALQLKAAAAGAELTLLTPYELWEALMETSMGTLTELKMGGFMEFLGKWLTRAVNLLIADQGLLPPTDRAAEELSSLMDTCGMI